jgi:hypothetical protein
LTTALVVLTTTTTTTTSTTTTFIMPHGDFSDVVGIFSLVTGLAGIFAPQTFFKELGPIKPFFDMAPTADLLTMLRFTGSLLVFMGIIMFCTRWNTKNGKGAAIGTLAIAINSALIAWNMDNQTFVLRGWYIFAGIFLAGTIHMAFFANPMLTSALLLEEEKKTKKSK